MRFVCLNLGVSSSSDPTDQRQGCGSGLQAGSGPQSGHACWSQSTGPFWCRHCIKHVPWTSPMCCLQHVNTGCSPQCCIQPALALCMAYRVGCELDTSHSSWGQSGVFAACGPHRGRFMGLIWTSPGSSQQGQSYTSTACLCAPAWPYTLCPAHWHLPLHAACSMCWPQTSVALGIQGQSRTHATCGINTKFALYAGSRTVSPWAQSGSAPDPACRAGRQSTRACLRPTGSTVVR